MSKEKQAKVMMPSVLAFEKKLVPSDGYLYGTTWEKRKTEAFPLKLIEKSVRGTISNRLTKKELKDYESDPLKLNAKIENANLQKIDTCSLGEQQDTLKLHFTLKVLGGVEKPSACNSEQFNKSYTQVAQAYIERTGFKELAKRYAMNIANGRFFWRNRVGAEKLEVAVTIGNNQPLVFEKKDFDLHDYEKSNPQLQILADKISDALCGKLPYLLITVDAYALIGKAQEVYPSEELVLDKGKAKEDKSKILYSVNDVAAMHSQKIGNAIRTIDTWYPEYKDAGIGPIAIEPYGAVTNLGKAYRTPNDKVDFFTLFDRFALGEELASPELEHYVMAVLVRGGVFGQSSKENS